MIYVLGRPTLCSECTNKNALSAKDRAPVLSRKTEKKKQGWATRPKMKFNSSRQLRLSLSIKSTRKMQGQAQRKSVRKARPERQGTRTELIPHGNIGPLGKGPRAGRDLGRPRMVQDHRTTQPRDRILVPRIVRGMIHNVLIQIAAFPLLLTWNARVHTTSQNNETHED